MHISKQVGAQIYPPDARVVVPIQSHSSAGRKSPYRQAKRFPEGGPVKHIVGILAHNSKSRPATTAIPSYPIAFPIPFPIQTHPSQFAPKCECETQLAAVSFKQRDQDGPRPGRAYKRRKYAKMSFTSMCKVCRRHRHRRRLLKDPEKL